MTSPLLSWADPGLGRLSGPSLGDNALISAGVAAMSVEGV